MVLFNIFTNLPPLLDPIAVVVLDGGSSGCVRNTGCCFGEAEVVLAAFFVVALAAVRRSGDGDSCRVL